MVSYTASLKEMYWHLTSISQMTHYCFHRIKDITFLPWFLLVVLVNLKLNCISHSHGLSSYCTGPAYGQEWVLWRRVNIAQPWSGASCGGSKCILITTIQRIYLFLNVQYKIFRDAFTFSCPFNFPVISFFSIAALEKVSKKWQASNTLGS